MNLEARWRRLVCQRRHNWQTNISLLFSLRLPTALLPCDSMHLKAETKRTNKTEAAAILTIVCSYQIFFSHTKKTLHRAFLGSLVVGEEKRKNYCLCGSQNFQNRNYYSTSAHLDNENVKKCIKKQHGVKCQLYYKWGGITKIEKKKKTQWMKRPWQEEILLTDGRWRKKWSEPTNEKQFRNIKSRNWSVFPSKSEKTVSPEDEKPCAEQFLWPGRPVKIQEFQANCWGHCYRRQQWAR